MPADCEVYSCGVPAIGRCWKCKSAFCLSHKSPPYTDYCVACVEKDDVASRERQDALSNAVRRIAKIASTLNRAGVPAEKCHHALRWREEGLAFRLTGKAKQVEDPSAHLYGWPVGTFSWREQYTIGGHNVQNRERSVELQTFVTSAGQIVPEGGSGGRNLDVGFAHLGGTDRLDEIYQQILVELESIAAKNGVKI